MTKISTSKATKRYAGLDVSLKVTAICIVDDTGVRAEAVVCGPCTVGANGRLQDEGGAGSCSKVPKPLAQCAVLAHMLARRRLYFLQYTIELTLRSHQRMHVLDGAHLAVLHNRSLATP
jgi:hypothetical protein